MKRSEMLLKIAKHLHKKAMELDEESRTYTADPDFESFKQVWIDDADELLGMLEKEGMLPLFGWGKE